MSLVLAWLVFPLLLAAITLGGGLALEALAGTRLPVALLPPAGLAAVVVVMCLATLIDATAELAVPLVVALAVVGLAVGAGDLRDRLDPWTAGVGITAYAVYAAPTVASGQATFAGYVKLDDTATWLGILDYVLERGTHVTGLAPSTYEAMVSLWLGDGYPVGSLVPLGVTKLLDVDPAWTWQPYLSFLAALLALVLHELIGGLVRSTSPARPRRGGGKRIRAHLRVRALGRRQGALRGGPVGLLAATAAATWRGRLPTALVPAVAAAAFLDGLSVAGAIWLVPLVVVVLVGAWRHRALANVAIAAGATLALAVPALLAAPAFLDNAEGVARGTDDTGNLLGPLSPGRSPASGLSPISASIPGNTGRRSSSSASPWRPAPMAWSSPSGIGRGACSRCSRRPWSVRSSFTSRRGRGSRRRRLLPPRPASSRWRSWEERPSSSRGAGSKERSSWRRSSAVSRGRMCWALTTRTWRRAPGSRSCRRSGSAMPATGRP